MQAISTHNPARQEALFALASRSKEIWDENDVQKDAVKAIAAEIASFVQADAETRSITDFLLNRKPTQVGDVKMVSKPNHAVYWLNQEGTFKSSKDHSEVTTVPAVLLTARLIVNLLDLRRGHVAPMDEQVGDVIDKITGKLNKYACDLLIASAVAANTVTVAGSLDAETMDDALAKLEDLGLVPRLFAGRASVFSAVKADTTIGNGVKDEWQMKGMQNSVYGGASLLYVPEMPTTSVLLLADRLPGNVQDEFELEQKEIESNDRLDVGMKLYKTTRMWATNANRFALITIT